MNKITLDNSDGIKIMINEQAEIIDGTLKGRKGLVVSYDPFISIKYGIKKNCGIVLMKLDDETFALVSADWVKQDLYSELPLRYEDDIKCDAGWILLNMKKEPIGIVVNIDFENRMIKLRKYWGSDTFVAEYDEVKDRLIEKLGGSK